MRLLQVSNCGGYGLGGLGAAGLGGLGAAGLGGGFSNYFSGGYRFDCPNLYLIQFLI